MGETDGPTGQPRPAAPCPVVMATRESYYRALVRLAGLLIGDAEAAEEIAGDALAALPPWLRLGSEREADTLRFLQQQVVIRCRRIRRGPAGRPARGPGQRAAVPPAASATATTAATAAAAEQPGPGEPGFARLPVVRALQDLPPRGREAVVLRLYLDLSEEQAAAMAGMTEAVLRQQLARALHTLRSRLPSD